MGGLGIYIMGLVLGYKMDGKWSVITFGEMPYPTNRFHVINHEYCMRQIGDGFVIYFQKLKYNIILYIMNDIQLIVKNIKELSKDEYNNLIAQYKRSQNKLCINNSEQTQDLLEEISETYTYNTIGDIVKEIIYLYQSNEIIAFALISIKNKIITLDLLCGNSDKTITYKYKKLGIYLLDYIYLNYITESDNKFLKIEPATNQLINYYMKWKSPIIPPSLLDETYNYLIYGDIANLDENDELFRSFRAINSLKKILNINSNETLLSKEILESKIDDSSIEEELKEQLKTKVESINFFSISDLLNKVSESNESNESLSAPPNGNEYSERSSAPPTSSGGKRKSRKSKKTKKAKKSRKKKTRKRNRKTRRH